MTAHHQPTAAIVAIGDELTTGQALDTNSMWLSSRLTDAGYRITEHATVPDDTTLITATLERLAATNAAVIATGGLGPTADDLSRDALAELLHEPLITDDRQLHILAERFKARGRELSDANARQALRPIPATCIDNPNGTAPALHAIHNGAHIIILPGPPRENQPIFVRFLQEHRTTDGPSIAIRVIQHFGIPESDAAQRLGSVLDRNRNPVVGITASDGVIACRIRYTGPADNAERELQATDDAIATALSEFRIGTGTASLAEHAVNALRQARVTLRVAESCTGGMLASRVTAVPGSSDVFDAGWIVYANEAKQHELRVSPDTLKQHGAVSTQVAEQLATAAATRNLPNQTQATAALAITGIAGPGGATPTKPVGTVFITLARADRNTITHTETRHFVFPGDRHAVRSKSAQAALAMLLFNLQQRRLGSFLWESTAAN